MSGESQRWMCDEPLPPAAHLIAGIQKRFDAGEMSSPLSGHWSLARVPGGDAQRAKQIDGALERRLCAVPLPAAFEASLHALIMTLADDLTG